MLKRCAYLLIILSGLFLSSCDPEDIDETTKTYWESNAWVRLQLKGKVKSVKESANEQFTITNFNDKGQITSTEEQYPNNEPYVVNYTYNSSNQLESDGELTYSYGSHGKYIPVHTFHINHAGLIKNLSGTSTEYGSTEFKFEGNNLLMINTYQSEKDTSVIQYTDNYPTSFTHMNGNWGEFMEATYAENGMFAIYEEGFLGTGENTYRDSRKHYYKSDSEYLLIDKTVMTYTATTVDVTTITYTYNDKKDVVKVETKDNDGKVTQKEDISYEYDSTGNWTKKIIVYTYDGQSREPMIITREYTYY